MGPAGTLGFLLTMGLYSGMKKAPTPLADLYSTIYPDVGNQEIEKLFDVLISGNSERYEKNSVIPFMDVLNKGTAKRTDTQNNTRPMTAPHHLREAAGTTGNQRFPRRSTI